MHSRLSATSTAACPSTAVPGQPRWPRPNTVTFQVAGLEKGSRAAAQDTLKDVLKVFPAAQVMGLQPRGGNGYHLTFTSQVAVLKALETGILVNGHLAEVTQVSGGFTVINLTDFPMELPDAVIKKELAFYGDVKKVECCRYPPELGGLLNGDRKIFMSMKRKVPNIVNIAGFECVAWYRDVDKLCRRCGKGGHKAADCEQPLVRVQRCGICGNRWHSTSACKGCRDCQTETHGSETCPRKTRPAETESASTDAADQQEDAADASTPPTGFVTPKKAKTMPSAMNERRAPLITTCRRPLIAEKPLPTTAAGAPPVLPVLAINKPPVLAIASKTDAPPADAAGRSMDQHAQDLANSILFGHLRKHVQAAKLPTYARKKIWNSGRKNKQTDPQKSQELKKSKLSDIIRWKQTEEPEVAYMSDQETYFETCDSDESLDPTDNC